MYGVIYVECISNGVGKIESTWCHVHGLHNRSDNTRKLIVQTCASHSPHWLGEKPIEFEVAKVSII